MSDLWRRVGGPAAVSWPAFWVVLGFSAVIVLADAVPGFQPGDLPARLVAVVVPVVAMFAVLLLLRRLFLRDVAEQPRPGRTLAVFLAAATVRGLGVVWLLDLLGGIDPQYAFRVSASILIMTPMLVITAAIVDRARERAERRDALAAATARLRAAEDRAQAEVAAARAATVDRIRGMLLRAVEDAAAATPAGAVERLRREVDEVIRPISHALAQAVPAWTAPAEPIRAGEVDWRDLRRDVTRGRPFRPVVVGVLGLVMSLPSAITMGGPVVGVLAAGVVGVGYLCLLAAAERIAQPRLEREPRAGRRLLLFLVASIAASLATAAALGLVGAAGGAPLQGLAVAVVVAGPVLATAIALVQAVDANLREVAAELDATVVRLDRAVARVNAVAWQEQRVLALAIHGPLQARVMAAALRLEQDVLAGTAGAEAVDTALASVLEAIGEIDAATAGESDILADVADVAEAWEGVCAVRIDLDERLAARIDRDPVAAQALVDVFTEACSNAVRHASARTVEIAVDHPEDELLRLVVRDDGRGEEPSGLGLGSRLLDDVAVRWERRSEPGGTVLEAVLPMRPG